MMVSITTMTFLVLHYPSEDKEKTDAIKLMPALLIMLMLSSAYVLLYIIDDYAPSKNLLMIIVYSLICIAVSLKFFESLSGIYKQLNYEDENADIKSKKKERT